MTASSALWPQISGQAAAAWYVTYLLCLWDVETLVLIVPPAGGDELAPPGQDVAAFRKTGHNEK